MLVMTKWVIIVIVCNFRAELGRVKFNEDL